MAAELDILKKLKAVVRASVARRRARTDGFESPGSRGQSLLERRKLTAKLLKP